jgi:GntR family transcriptional regulator/MocR family aminotransferase
MGLPALDLFPRGLWARVMGRRLRTQSRFDLAPGDPGGDPLLRQAIVDYLRLSRSIDCQPDQVLITGNYAASMNLILRTWRSRDSICGWRIRVSALSGRSSRLGNWLWMPFRGRRRDGCGWGSAITPGAICPAHTSAPESAGGRAVAAPRRQLLAWAAGATRGSLRTITIASFAITANRCRR